MADLLDAVTVVIGLLVVGALAVTVAGRVVRRRRDLRRARRLARVRPIVAGVAMASDDDREPGTVIDTIGRGDRAVLEALALDVVPKLRGSGRQAIIDVLVHRGVADDARRRLRSRRPGVVARCRAALILGQLVCIDDDRLLIEQLASRHPELRIAAVRALGRLATRDAVEALVACLREPDRFPAGIVGASLVDSGSPAVAPLAEALADLPVVGRQVAIEVLGEGFASVARDRIDACLGDDEPRVRVAAAAALAALGSPRSVPSLVGLLVPTQPAAVRAAAAGALGSLGGREAIDHLSVLVGDDEHVVAMAAAEGLARSGPGGRAALVRIEAAGSGDASRHAAAALFEVGR